MDEHDTEDDDCAFCLGREAAHQGAPESANPYVREDVELGSIEWYETDFALWEIGHGIGAKEPGGVPWHARPDTENGPATRGQ